MKIAYRRLSAWLLGILGFASCDVVGIGNGVDMYGTAVVMYGCPNAKYSVKASVTDENGKPIEGIEVAVIEKFADGQYHKVSYSAAKTAADGSATSTVSTYPTDDLGVCFSDVDGAENGGTFQADTVKNVVFTQTKKGDGAWYKGDYEAKVSVKLKKQ